MEKVYVLLCGDKLIAVYANSFDAWDARDYANKHCFNSDLHTVEEVNFNA